MRRFRYLRDPLFLAGCAAYAINRWLLKPQVHSGFLHSYFNDLLLIPCALPPVLLVQACLKLRPWEEGPRPAEIVFQLCLWAILFEWVGPRLMARATGDVWDVAAYVAGGLFAGLWWQWRRWRPRPVPS